MAKMFEYRLGSWTLFSDFPWFAQIDFRASSKRFKLVPRMDQRLLCCRLVLLVRSKALRPTLDFGTNSQPSVRRPSPSVLSAGTRCRTVYKDTLVEPK